MAKPDVSKSTDIAISWKEKPFFCTQCSFSSKDGASILKHIRIHGNQKIYICQDSKCSYTTKHSFGLKAHIKTVHLKIRDHVCNTCGSSFPSAFQLRSHDLTHQIDRPFKCTTCSAAFKTKTLLRKHTRIHEEIGAFPCKYNDCDYRAKTRVSLKYHVNLVHLNTRFKCDKCDYESVSVYRLRSHQMIHTEEKSYKCNFCGYASRYSTNLKRHLITHTNERLFACSECPYKGSNSEHLKAHAASHDERLLISCPVERCGFKSGHKSALWQHNKSRHSNLKPFKCSLCSYRSSRNYLLRQHIAIHTREKPFKCRFCQYEAVSKGQLNTHINRDHNEGLKNDQRVQCSVCQKDFRTKCKLKAHSVLHSEERPHACSFCPYRAKVRSEMVKHLRRHTLEKPFRCEVCGKEYRNRPSLTHHLKICSTGRPNLEKARVSTQPPTTNGVRCGKRLLSCGKCRRCFGHGKELKIHSCTDNTGELTFKNIVKPCFVLLKRLNIITH